MEEKKTKILQHILDAMSFERVEPEVTMEGVRPRDGGTFRGCTNGDEIILEYIENNPTIYNIILPEVDRMILHDDRNIVNYNCDRDQVYNSLYRFTDELMKGNTYPELGNKICPYAIFHSEVVKPGVPADVNDSRLVYTIAYHPEEPIIFILTAMIYKHGPQNHPIPRVRHAHPWDEEYAAAKKYIENWHNVNRKFKIVKPGLLTRYDERKGNK